MMSKKQPYYSPNRAYTVVTLLLLMLIIHDTM